LHGTPEIRRLAGLCLLLLAGCGPGTAYQRHLGATMGTYYQVTANCPGKAPERIAGVVETTLAAVNSAMSTYDDHSELSRFNRSAPGTWFPVSPQLARVAAAAKRLSDFTAGAFDVTVGPLVNLWGFGPDGVGPEPGADELAAALARVGDRFFEVRLQPPALRKTGPIYVDLSAIAKGYGVDAVVAALQSVDCQDLLVDIGGEVRALGLNARGQSWRIGVELPDPDRSGRVQSVVELNEGAMATSGDYRNFIDGDSGRRSHTIDPRSGVPVRHAMTSVSVMAPSAMIADGWATAFMVVGPERTREIAARHDLAYLAILRTAKGFRSEYNDRMAALLQRPDGGGAVSDGPG
jgi:thiamine biosynthesis lipoprotein